MLTESWIGGVLKVCIYRELSRHRVIGSSKQTRKQVNKLQRQQLQPLNLTKIGTQKNNAIIGKFCRNYFLIILLVINIINKHIVRLDYIFRLLRLF